MKNRFCSVPSKTICFLLCVISICIFAASVIGAIVLGNEGYYTSSKEQLLDDEFYGTLFTDASRLIRNTVFPDIAQQLEYTFDINSTNLRYRIIDHQNNVVRTNLDDPSNASWKYIFKFNKTELVYTYGVGDTPIKDCYTFEAYLEPNLPINDSYGTIAKIVGVCYDLRYWVFLIAAVSFILAISMFVLLMCASGRRPKTDEIHGGVLNRVPFDLLLAVVGFVVMAYVLVANELRYSLTGEIIAIGGFVLLVTTSIVSLSMSIAARIKQKTFFKNTVTFMAFKLFVKFTKLAFRKTKALFGKIKRLFQMLPMLWKSILAVIILFFVDFFIIISSLYNSGDFGLFVAILKNGALCVVLVYTVLHLRTLQKGAEKLAEGDLEHKIDTSKMFWDLKKHGDNLNHISDGMSIAVENRLQSERTKAELITNVSHDIKTPLTSIINYASLIGEEDCDAERRKEYSEVLVRKSKHLKRLLEDLVEISKATTGNLEVSLSKCDTSVLLSQLLGEFGEMCDRANLELVINRSEKPILIMADSRRIWRVFENLMNNACKYSLERSRVYVSVEEKDGMAVFVFRNTSKNALNIIPEELTERFVRGDASRSTEGNGLGLSIAKSLTEIQNGTMDIKIDGDLFKVILSFPII